MRRLLVYLFVTLSCMYLYSCGKDSSDDGPCDSVLEGNNPIAGLNEVGEVRDFKFYKPTDMGAFVNTLMNQITENATAEKAKGKLYFSFTTAYDAGYLGELKSTCKSQLDVATSGSGAVGVRFREEGKACIVDAYSCMVNQVTSLVETESVSAQTSINYTLATLSTVRTTFKVADFIKDDCEASMTFNNPNSVKSVIGFNAPGCIINPVEGVLEGDVDYEYSGSEVKYSVSLEGATTKFLRKETKEEFLNTTFRKQINFNQQGNL